MSRGGERHFLPYLGTSRGLARVLSEVRPIFFFRLKTLSSHPSCNRDRGILQLALCPSINIMASGLARNKKSRVRPPTHHHILDRRVCDEVPHVRFPSHSRVVALNSNTCSQTAYPTSSTHFQENPLSAPQSIKRSSSLRARTTSFTCSRFRALTSRNGSKSGRSRLRRRAPS